LSVFRQMADMSNDAFYLCDREGRFLYVNDRALKYTGYTRDEMLCMSVSELNPDYPPERLREFVTGMRNGSTLPQFETINKRKDGSVVPVELSVASIDIGGEFYMFGVVRDITERRQIEVAQRNFTQRVLQTLEAERQRVARELHDDVGQAIATVGVLLHTLEHDPDAVPAEARPALAATHVTIRQITESVARIVRDYHPADLLGLGIEDTVRTHARQFARRHGLSLRLATSAIAGVLPQEHELHLYRIIQEALANVARHAAARKVSVRLGRERRRVVAVVRDDGVGFTPDPGRTSGLGLVTMRERAELMGADLVVTSRAHGGTEVRIAIPVLNAASTHRRSARRAATTSGKPTRPRPRAAPARPQPPARGGRRGGTSIA
jgi:two-component system sensor histidine kinase UhpB